MSVDIETLILWARVCIMISGVATSLFVILFALVPWWKSWVGRAMMFQAFTLSLVIDLRVVFIFWEPQNPSAIYWGYAIVFTLVAAATSWLSWVMLSHNYFIKENQHEPVNIAPPRQ